MISPFRKGDEPFLCREEDTLLKRRNMNELIITQAVKEDLPIILDIQRKAFLEVARTFHLKSMPQIEQTLESLTAEFKNHTILKASLADTIVGSVRAYH